MSAGDRLLRLAVLLGANAVAVAIGLAIGLEPITATLGATILVLGFAALRWPDLGTVAACFLLYSNAPVIAVKFHGLPYVVGAAYPLLMLIPICAAVFLRRRRVILPPALPWITLFLVVQGLGTAFSPDPAASWGGLSESLFEGLLIYLLVVNAVRSTQTLRRVTWALLLGGIVLGSIPVYQQLTGSFHSDFGGFGQFNEVGFNTGAGASQLRLTGAIGEQNRYSQVMLVLLPIAFLRIGAERSPLPKLLAALATVVIAGGFTLAFSRGGAVALVLLGVVALAIRAVSPRQATVAVIGAAIVLAAMPQYLARLATVPGVRLLLGEEETGRSDGAIRGRTTVMIAAAQVFLDHPLVGVGPRMYPRYSRRYGNELNLRQLDEDRRAHSLYLELAAEHGILGILAFAGIVLVVLRDLGRVRRRRDENPAAAALADAYLLALAAYLLSGLFLHLSYIRYFWLIVALATAAGRTAFAERPAPARAPEREPEGQALLR